jgi:hypothetical protein
MLAHLVGLKPKEAIMLGFTSMDETGTFTDQLTAGYDSPDSRHFAIRQCRELKISRGSKLIKNLNAPKEALFRTHAGTKPDYKELLARTISG